MEFPKYKIGDVILGRVSGTKYLYEELKDENIILLFKISGAFLVEDEDVVGLTDWVYTSKEHPKFIRESRIIQAFPANEVACCCKNLND